MCQEKYFLQKFQDVRLLKHSCITYILAPLEYPFNHILFSKCPSINFLLSKLNGPSSASTIMDTIEIESRHIHDVPSSFCGFEHIYIGVKYN